jgi:DNA-binding GntR family transcriptional regulator
MSPSHVLEPTYERLKRELLDGRWPQGTRLEAARIADDYSVSMTPVRDCLNRLTGEGLIVSVPGEGFRVPRLAEKELRDLLDLNLVLLSLVLARSLRPGPSQQILPRHPAPPETIDDLFGRVASGADNAAIAHVIGRISERLSAVRRIEERVVPEALAEFRNIRSLFMAGDPHLRRALKRYHMRRIQRAGDLVAALPLE